MSDLDKKLNEAIQKSIWISKIDDQVREKVHPDWFVANGSTFTFGIDSNLVKQVFIDAGWKDPAFIAADHSCGRTGEMTGQEWYDRFEKEYDQYATASSYNDPDALLAAKKAAGIE